MTSLKHKIAPAMVALSDIWSDSSIPIEDILLILESLRDEIEDRIATIAEEIDQ